MMNPHVPAYPDFTEHHVPRDRGSVYVRDIAGDGPAFVMLHGFPDNGRIYDEVIPYIAAAGRRAVTIDFLGFGASEKPDGARYSFAQQLGDLEAVVEHLGLGSIITVGHDAGGPAAVNYSLMYPKRTAGVILMNAFYGEAPGMRVPELIELFSNKKLKALQQHFLKSPLEFGWLLGFQREQMLRDVPDEQKERDERILGKIIDENFTQVPSAGAAFAQMTYQLMDEISANTAEMVAFRRSPVPLKLIWGAADPYLHLAVAEYLGAAARNATLHAVEAGHWPQIDAAEKVAALMLQH